MTKNDLDKLLSMLKGIDGVEVAEIRPEPTHANAFEEIAQDTKDCYDAFVKKGFADKEAWYMTRMVMEHILNDALSTEG